MSESLHIIEHLYGLPCWGVQRGHGSFLTMEFGQPHLEIREPIELEGVASPRVVRRLRSRGVHVHGDWYLWIYCCEWSVRDGSRVVGDWTSNRRVDRAAAFLDGQKLVQFTAQPRGTRCTFKFDLGAVLETKPYDRNGDQWMLYTPDGKVLTVRAGGRYALSALASPEGGERWLLLPEGAKE